MRMPETFSWTLAFKSSYRRNTCWKMGRVRPITPKSATPSTTRAARNTRLSRGEMTKHMAMEHRSIRGARTAMRRLIWKAIWVLVTSVVIRVTRLAVLNLSMLEKE